MNYTRISELNDVSILLVRCIREWVKAVFYSQNPMPTLKFLLSIHKAEKTAIPFDNFMASIILSRSKKIDFRTKQCCLLSKSENDILSIMYNFQVNNEQIGIKLMGNMVEKSYWNTAVSCSKLICKDFTDLGLFFNIGNKNYRDEPTISNVINFDFKSKKYI
tara:strand:- start:95 stop:580 length:486 start_codon:yes stop_codon:yes gene_type:complete